MVCCNVADVAKDQPVERGELVSLKTELAKRLRELREHRFGGMDPEGVAEEARARKTPIGARTIRDYENPKTCNPTLSNLFTLLNIYDATLGDLFRFTMKAEDPRLIGEFVQAIRDPEAKKMLSTLLSMLRPKTEP